MDAIYAIKWDGEILPDTVSTDRNDLLKAYGDILSKGGEIVPITIDEVQATAENRHNAYAFFTPQGLFGGGIYKGKASAPEKLETGSPISRVVYKFFKRPTYDTLFLMDIVETHEHFHLKCLTKVPVTEDGDSTTVAKMVREGGLDQLIARVWQDLRYQAHSSS